MKTTSAEYDVFQVFTEIAIINQLVKTAVESSLPGKLRMSHFGVMSHFIRRPHEQSPGHLASSFQVTNAAMTNTLGKMQRWGYVDIRKNPNDSRAKLVSLSEKGSKAYQEAFETIIPIMQQMLKDVDAETILALEPGLRDLRIKLDASRN
ncbi:MAG: MarR family transcriptional regulator [Robiginitomaculum sp.]|nr:MarR family transcriptional regulator [Robiginitomaculum sp.]